MTKFDKLRKHLVDRLKLITKLVNEPHVDKDINGYSNIELELKYILNLMIMLDDEERLDHEREIERRVKEENTAISDSAEDEFVDSVWYFNGTPNFDKLSKNKILKQLNLKND